MGINHSIPKSFKYALEGIGTAFKKEPNLRIHSLFALIAIIAGLVLKLDKFEWIIITLTIFYVISLELINTVLENLVDLHSPDLKPQAKVAKDVSAAVVLIAAVLSIIIGAFIFLPKIF